MQNNSNAAQILRSLVEQGVLETDNLGNIVDPSNSKVKMTNNAWNNWQDGFEIHTAGRYEQEAIDYD